MGYSFVVHESNKPCVKDCIKDFADTAGYGYWPVVGHNIFCTFFVKGRDISPSPLFGVKSGYEDSVEDSAYVF